MEGTVAITMRGRALIHVGADFQAKARTFSFDTGQLSLPETSSSFKGRIISTETQQASMHGLRLCSACRRERTKRIYD